MIQFSWCVDDVAAILAVEDFCDPAHRAVYHTVCHMRGAGLSVGLESVVDELQRAGRLQDAGGPAGVGELYDKAIGTAVVEGYCKKIRDHSLMERLWLTGAEIQELARTPRGRAGDMIAEAEQKVFALSKTDSAGDVRQVSPIVQEVFDRIDARSRGGDTGLKTGLTDLDLMTTGLHGGELVVIGARPGVGKTTLALNVAGEAAACGDRTLFCSLEMSEIELVERLIVRESGVPAQDVRAGVMDAVAIAKFQAAGHKVQAWPLHVDDSSSQGVARIASTCRRMHAMGLKLVVIDYLQLVACDNRRASRQEQVAGISRDLKRLAREVGVPVIALAQINRMSEQRTDKKPRLSDLRESGGIEADADVVLLLHQSDPGQLDVIVAKQRNGPLGEIKVRYDPQFHRIRDV